MTLSVTDEKSVESINMPPSSREEKVRLIKSKKHILCVFSQLKLFSVLTCDMIFCIVICSRFLKHVKVITIFIIQINLMIVSENIQA